MAGLISDTVLPRQKAFILALLVKLLGSLLSFGSRMVVYRMQGQPPDKLVQMLLWVNILGIALMVVAICFFPLFISFGSQQVNLEKNAVCSYLRWLLLTVALGALTAAGINKLNITKAFPGLTSFVCDVLSVVVFLVAIRKYNTISTDAGRRRFKEFMRILRAHVPCFCQRRRFDEAYDPWGNPVRLREIQEKRAMDRFHLKKGVLLVALLSCGAVAAMIYYLINCAGNLSSKLYDSHITRRILGYIDNLGGFVIFVLLLLLEAFTRCSQNLRIAINDNTLKKLGFGSIFAAFSCLLTGIVSTGQLVEGPENVSIYWMLPEFIIYGVGATLTLTSVLEIGVFESGPGLATFLCGLGASLSFIFFTVIGIVLTHIDYRTVKRFDYIYYVAFCVMAFTLLVILIPVSVWYTGVKRKISSLSLSMQERENDAGAPSQDRGQVESQESFRARELDAVVSQGAD
ncbi:uncharacterized protein LOC135489049 [Lineus longissimus]|uniref:uncharacterized protein LOC135489049 n=1 Tax=Lineus longissimus TaxID=88925 RepID=UPI002B4ECC73